MPSRLRSFVLLIAAPVASVVFAIVLSAIVLLVAGSNPIDAFGDMIKNGKKLETVVDMLNRATPLYISGIAAAIGFRMNLFNIGVEGQYLMGAFFGAAAGGVSSPPASCTCCGSCWSPMTVGAAWAGLAGILKTTRGVSEVISTIMLNSIAATGIVAWLSVEWRDGALSTNSGTKLIDESGHIFNLNWLLEIFTPDIKGGRHLSGVLVIALIVGIGYHLFVNRSRLGFDLRASGYNPLAARAGGVPPKRMVMMAMLLSGAVAGLVGMVDILSRTTDTTRTSGRARLRRHRRRPARPQPPGRHRRGGDAVRLPRHLVEHPPDHRLGIARDHHDHEGRDPAGGGDRLRVRAPLSANAKKCEWPRCAVEGAVA